MTKDKLKLIIDKYVEAERQVSMMDHDYGITIWNSKRENFYNKYNFIIFKLFEDIFGTKGKDLLEDYIFEQIEMDFDELCNALEIYE